MKKIVPIILCLLLFSCKEGTIPVVTVTTLPPELVGLGQDTLRDTIPYQIVEIKRDTITPDSIVVDTIKIDTFTVDTFYMDTIRLRGNVTYKGDNPYGPALLEYGFCVNDTSNMVVYQDTAALKTPQEAYGDFSYVTVVRNTAQLFVYTYAVNPYGTIRGETRRQLISDFDAR